MEFTILCDGNSLEAYSTNKSSIITALNNLISKARPDVDTILFKIPFIHQIEDLEISLKNILTWENNKYILKTKTASINCQIHITEVSYIRDKNLIDEFFKEDRPIVFEEENDERFDNLFKYFTIAKSFIKNGIKNNNQLNDCQEVLKKLSESEFVLDVDPLIIEYLNTITQTYINGQNTGK